MLRRDKTEGFAFGLIRLWAGDLAKSPIREGYIASCLNVIIIEVEYTRLAIDTEVVYELLAQYEKPKI